MNGRIVSAGLATLVAALALPAGASAGSASITIEPIGVNKFDPRVASYALLDNNFYWQWGAGGNTTRPHNFRQDAGLFRSGDPTASGGNISYSLSAGTFPYYCQVHGGKGGRGMSGIAKVAPSDGSPEPDGVPISWAVPASETGSRYALRFKVGNGDWRPWKRNTSALTDIFGRDDDPVNFSALKTYKIQARSQKQNADKHSGWSPTLVIP